MDQSPLAQPLQPQCTHSITFSSLRCLGTRQTHVVWKLWSRGCMHLKQHRRSYPGCQVFKSRKIIRNAREWGDQTRFHPSMYTLKRGKDSKRRKMKVRQSCMLLNWASVCKIDKRPCSQKNYQPNDFEHSQNILKKTPYCWSWICWICTSA